jgi:hypothetical protein
VTKTKLEAEVRAWQYRLGLERWKVEIKWDEPCDAENFADITKSSTYDTATLRLDAGWSKWTADFTRGIVVHELMHLLHRDVDEAFNDIEGQLQRDAWIMAERRYKQAMEGFIDRTATRLVEIAGES